MSKLFAFVPAAQFRADITETLIRFGHSKNGLGRFSGMLEPQTVLMCVDVPDGQEASNKLNMILRGHDPWSRDGAGSFFDTCADFRTSIAGYNFFRTYFKVPELKVYFEEIAKQFNPPPAGAEEGEADVEVQPGAPQPDAPDSHESFARGESLQPGEPEGEVVQMRAMSSAQAAAILCGIPGSIEDVLNNN
jgi:hypothetical protein